MLLTRSSWTPLSKFLQQSTSLLQVLRVAFRVQKQVNHTECYKFEMKVSDAFLEQKQKHVIQNWRSSIFHFSFSFHTHLTPR